MKRMLLCVVLLCTAIPLLHTSCKKSDVENVSRVYFTYRVGYYNEQAGGQEACTAGDGLCDFELREQSWRPTGTMPDGYGFGYLTLTPNLKLRMVIYMPFLSTATYKEHYADGVANLPGPWKLALQLTTKLKIVDGYTVSMGDYSVKLDNEDGYEVLVITF